jgi:hypothetical protein
MVFRFLGKSQQSRIGLVIAIARAPSRFGSPALVPIDQHRLATVGPSPVLVG